MADHILLLAHPDDPRSWPIIESFAERTGLAMERRGDGAAFPLHGDEHQVAVTGTLTQIEPAWSQHITLGDPAADGV